MRWITTEYRWRAFTNTRNQYYKESQCLIREWCLVTGRDQTLEIVTVIIRLIGANRQTIGTYGVRGEVYSCINDILAG